MGVSTAHPILSMLFTHYVWTACVISSRTCLHAYMLLARAIIAPECSIMLKKDHRCKNTKTSDIQISCHTKLHSVEELILTACFKFDCFSLRS